MKINGSLFMAIMMVMIVLMVLYKLKHPAITQTVPRSALEVFNSRPVWKKLPSDFLNNLANKLNSVEKATEFAQLCDPSLTEKFKKMAFELLKGS